MSTKNIDRMHAASGRLFKENDKLINVANVLERFDRTLGPLNAIEVAEPYPIISLKSNYGLSDLRDLVTVTGTGEVTNAVGDGKYIVKTGATANSTARLESLERGRYVSGTTADAGVGLLAPNNLTGDQVAYWGYLNNGNGCGFGEDSQGLFVFRRYQGSETKVYRADWDDPLDGTGPSGLTFELSNVDIYQMSFRWYGSGPINFKVSGAGTKTDTITVHTLEATSGEPILVDPNLPVAVEVDNGTTGGNVQVEVYGRQFSVLGRYEPNRRITSEFRIAQSVGTTFVPLISFRQKTAYRSVSVKTSGAGFLVANSNIIFQIRISPILTGASYNAPSNIPANETALEFDLSATAISNGQSIYTGLAAAGVGSTSIGTGGDIPELDLPVNENITLCARSVSGTATVTSVFRAREEW